MMQRKKSEMRQGGFALILVLWAVALLGLLAAYSATSVRSGALIARNAADNAAARALADGGVALAIAGLLDADGPGAWRADGIARDLDLKTGRLRVAVTDEGGKIDINAETGALLADLLRWLGLDAAEALALARRIAGQDTQPAATPPRPARRFAAVAELAGLPGMTPALYARLAPHVTVHSGQAMVNVQTASRDLLLALTGADPAAIDAFVATRRDRDAGPEDLPQGAATVQDRFDVLAVSVVTVTALGETASGARFLREAIVALEPAARRDAPYRILGWTQRFD